MSHYVFCKASRISKCEHIIWG